MSLPLAPCSSFALICAREHRERTVGRNKRRGGLHPLARGGTARGSGGGRRRSGGWRRVRTDVGDGECRDGTGGVPGGTEAALRIDGVAKNTSVAHLNGARYVSGELLREGRVHVRDGVV